MSQKSADKAETNGKGQEVDDEVEVVDGEDAGSDEAEEYEIEAILKDKKVKGGHEYLVSWKDYGPEHNSWVHESDFGSTELIDDYWASTQLAKTKVGRPGKGAASQRSKRRASADVAETNGASSSKRQKSSQKQKEVAADDDDEDDGEGIAATHKDSIRAYADLENWEDQVKHIETVERAPNNILVVYLVMKGGERTAQEAKTLYKRCPQQMLAFYERNLKWREVGLK